MSMPDPGAPPKQPSKEYEDKIEEMKAKMRSSSPDDNFEVIVTVKKVLTGKYFIMNLLEILLPIQV